MEAAWKLLPILTFEPTLTGDLIANVVITSADVTVALSTRFSLFPLRSEFRILFDEKIFGEFNIFKVEFDLETDAQLVYDSLKKQIQILGIPFQINVLSSSPDCQTNDSSNSNPPIDVLFCIDRCGTADVKASTSLTYNNNESHDFFVIDCKGMDNIASNRMLTLPLGANWKTLRPALKRPPPQKQPISKFDYSDEEIDLSRKLPNMTRKRAPVLSLQEKEELANIRKKFYLKYQWMINPDAQKELGQVKSRLVIFCCGFGKKNKNGGAGIFVRLDQVGADTSFVKHGIQLPILKKSRCLHGYFAIFLALHFISTLSPQFDILDEIVIKSDSKTVLYALFSHKPPNCPFALASQNYLKKITEESRFKKTNFQVGWHPIDENLIADEIARNAQFGTFETGVANSGVPTSEMCDLFLFVEKNSCDKKFGEHSSDYKPDGVESDWFERYRDLNGVEEIELGREAAPDSNDDYQKRRKNPGGYWKEGWNNNS